VEEKEAIVKILRLRKQ
jgi:hypothetical protein